ncbi:peptidase M24, structural domain-containing protein [Mycena leptocephala]|nr:peptidase M24, structural domain-containing protein [Mycena leptocephala]
MLEGNFRVDSWHQLALESLRKSRTSRTRILCIAQSRGFFFPVLNSCLAKYHPMPLESHVLLLRVLFVGCATVGGRIFYASRRRPEAHPRILNAEEIEKMRTICRMSREVLDLAAAAIRPGVTTDEIDEIVHNATIERNAYPSDLNYRKFPKSVCTQRGHLPRYTRPKEAERRDIINLDISVYYQGFHGDLNGTYPVGQIDEESAKLIRTTRECLDKAIEICKPGALFRDIGKIIEPIAHSNGCTPVRTYIGHGINSMFHDAPDIPHYAKNKAVGTMKPGMVFTIEPMINLGSNWNVVHWPDNWTATTVDGKRSAQFEETLLITETGVEVLTAVLNNLAA